MTKDIRQVELGALVKSNDTGLTLEQIQKFFTATPASKVKVRPAKGGGQWKYVSGSYTTQVLNSLFGFNWSFEVITPMTDALKTATTGVVVVQGRLKVKVGDEWIIKEQYGRKEVTYRKGTKDLLDFGNDLKAAATDAKKKCASELGLFADVYSQEDFFEAEVVEQSSEVQKNTEALKKLNQVKSLEELKATYTNLSPAEQRDAEVIRLKDELKEKLSEDN